APAGGRAAPAGGAERGADGTPDEGPGCDEDRDECRDAAREGCTADDEGRADTKQGARDGKVRDRGDEGPAGGAHSGQSAERTEARPGSDKDRDGRDDNGAQCRRDGEVGGNVDEGGCDYRDQAGGEGCDEDDDAGRGRRVEDDIVSADRRGARTDDARDTGPDACEGDSWSRPRRIEFDLELPEQQSDLVQWFADTEFCAASDARTYAHVVADTEFCAASNAHTYTHVVADGNVDRRTSVCEHR